MWPLYVAHLFPFVVLSATVSVKGLNMGVGGEMTADMLRRLERDVLAHDPALVIWQTGSNSLLRGADPSEHHQAMTEGLARLRAADIDVVLMDPQYAPRVLEKQRHRELVADLERDAAKAHAGLFKRFEVMRAWHEGGIGFEESLSADGLHMNDWSYGCLARLLADSLAAAAGRRPIAPTALASD